MKDPNRTDKCVDDNCRWQIVVRNLFAKLMMEKFELRSQCRRWVQTRIEEICKDDKADKTEKEKSCN